MIARHEGAIVFVSGAIPGEVVEARIEKTQRGTVWARAERIEQPSGDRIEAPDLGCGGSVFAHIAYPRQLTLKSEIIGDAFRRIGKLPLDQPVEVTASPIDGYRMRARLHLRGGRLGFFREGTHELCGYTGTRQLLPASAHVLDRMADVLASQTINAEVELSETVDATARAVHFDLSFEGDAKRIAGLAGIAGLTGVSYAIAGHPRTIELHGSPHVTDRIDGIALSRHVRSFFQGNRFLIEPLTAHVVALIDDGPVLDLYAGVGLFSVAAAAAGRGPVTAIEGDRYAAADLARNAEGHDVRVDSSSVEAFVARPRGAFATAIVDPPRTGMSREALTGVIALKCRRVVYVSCDVATLARDARALIDAGYAISSMRAFDMFPTTAHIETVISFER